MWTASLWPLKLHHPWCSLGLLGTCWATSLVWPWFDNGIPPSQVLTISCSLSPPGASEASWLSLSRRSQLLPRHWTDVGRCQASTFQCWSPCSSAPGLGWGAPGEGKAGRAEELCVGGGGRLHVERALPPNWHQETRAQQAGDSPKLSLSSLVNEHFSKDGLRPPAPKQLVNSASPCCFWISGGRGGGESEILTNSPSSAVTHCRLRSSGRWLCWIGWVSPALGFSWILLSPDGTIYLVYPIWGISLVQIWTALFRVRRYHCWGLGVSLRWGIHFWRHQHYYFPSSTFWVSRHTLEITWKERITHSESTFLVRSADTWSQWHTRIGHKNWEAQMCWSLWLGKVQWLIWHHISLVHKLRP